jgi:hypothetical protein
VNKVKLHGFVCNGYRNDFEIIVRQYLRHQCILRLPLLKTETVEGIAYIVGPPSLLKEK